jgi:hypothetical protein
LVGVWWWWWVVGWVVVLVLLWWWLVWPNHGSRFDSNGNVTRGPNASGTVTNLPILATSYDATTDILTIG